MFYADFRGSFTLPITKENALLQLKEWYDEKELKKLRRKPLKQLRAIIYTKRKDTKW